MPQGPFRIEVYHGGRLQKISSGPQGETFDTQKVAHQWLARINSEIQKKRFDPTAYNKNRGRGLARWSFARYGGACLDEKVADVASGEIAPSTLRMQRLYLSRHLAPLIGEKDIRELGRAELKELRTRLLERKADKSEERTLSPKYVWNILAFVHSVLAEAKRDGMIESVPDLPPNTKRKTKPRVLQHAAQLAVLRWLDTNEPGHAPIMWALYFTGHRPSEAAALRVRDYWRDQRMLDFARTYSNGHIKEGRKEGDEHLVPIPDQLCDILDRMLSERREGGSIEPHPDSPLFVPPQVKKGRPALAHYRNHGLAKIWRRACRESGISYIGLYRSTKHSLATRAIRMGVTRPDLALLLGITEESTRFYTAEAEAESLRPTVETLHPKADAKRVAENPTPTLPPEPNR